MNVGALCFWLGLDIKSVDVYATYESVKLGRNSATANLSTLKTPLGEKAESYEQDWKNGIIRMKLDSEQLLPFQPVQMTRKIGWLVGEAEID